MYSDINKINIITQNLYSIGTPGYDQAGLLFVLKPNSPKNIYFEFAGPVTFDLNVLIP